MKDSSTNAVIYCRISQDRTGAGLGIERQEADCKALAEARGWNVTDVYVDDDISAYSGKIRPSYRRMLDRLDEGQIQVVICWHTDRLHRSPRELEEYIDVSERHHVTTHAVRSGELDLSTPSGRVVARTLGAMARYESEHKSDRIKRAAEQAAKAGRWAGGARPFGWHFEKDGLRVDKGGTPVIDETEAKEVLDATETVLAGGSLGGIVKSWNDRGILTTTGKKWSYATLRQVLRRPRNSGLSTWHGQIVGVSEFPPIVTEDAWRSVCHILENPSRRRSQSNRARWLLAGIAVCECGQAVKSGSAGSRDGLNHPIYRCSVPGPGHVAKRAADIDAYVASVVVGVLQRPDIASRIASRLGEHRGEGAAELQLKAMTLRARLEEVADSYSGGKVTLSQLERITDRVTQELATVESQMIGNRGGSVVAGLAGPNAAALWDVATVERKRAVIDAMVTVTIYRTPPGRRRVFDPESVHIEWKDQGIENSRLGDREQ